MSATAVSHSRGSGISRLLRGWVVATIAVVLAAGGHQAVHRLVHGSAETIPLQLLAFSIAVTAPVAVAFAGRGPSKRTAATTIFGQIAFHLLYSMASPGGHTDHGSQAHQDHGHHQLIPGGGASDTVHAVHGATADVIMVLAHLLAAALTTAIVIYGEHSVLTIIAWLTLAPSRTLATRQPLAIGAPKTLQAMYTVWIPHPLTVCQTRSTRGPPVLA